MDKTIPHNPAAEEAVLGSLLISQDEFYGLSEILSSSAFFIHRNRWIWEAIKILIETRVPIDILTVSTQLQREGKLDEIGGSAYLTKLISGVPTSINALAYAKAVRETADDRRLLDLANNVAKLAYEDKPLPQKIKEAKAALEAMDNNIIVEDDFQPLKEIFSEVYDEAEKRSKDPKDVWGIPTGLPILDKETGGQQGGELTFWVGEPGVGKTWLLTGIALEMSKYCAGGFLSMELKKQNIARRIMSGASGVPTKAIRTGHISTSDWKGLTAAVEDNEHLPLYLMYRSITSEQLFHIVRQAKLKYNFGFLIIDYAMLFVDPGKDETERTSIVSRNLKKIATDFDVAVNCIHSVVKTSMDGADPSKAGMRGSGQQIHDADNVYFLTKYKKTSDEDGFLREEQEKKMVTLWCKKGRELENSDFHIHLVRKGTSPFFAEYSREAARLERGI